MRPLYCVLVGIAAIFFLGGCAKSPMTNEEIIVECKKCTDNDMRIIVYRNAWGATRVECAPNSEDHEVRTAQ